MSVYVWDGETARATAQYVMTATGPVPASSMRAMPSGYASSELLETESRVFIAHRGGSLNWPEMSLYAYTRAVEWGVGVLEVSLARTSDGVWFGLHDQTLDRTSGTSGANPQSMTWAQVQAYNITAANTNDPSQPVRPYMRLSSLLDAYGDSHLIMFDPKYTYSNATWLNELFTILLQHAPAERLVGKYAISAQGFANACRTRGIKCWGYAYESDVPNLPTQAPAWDFLGMEWSASQEAWDAALAYDKPVFGHICATAGQVTTALGKGASGCMVSGVMTLDRRESESATPPPPPPPVVTDQPGRVNQAGSLPLGSTSYAIPAGALYVSPSGNDTSGTGAIGAPYATLAKAASMVAAGGTIVMRQGVYHEGTSSAAGLGVVVSGKTGVVIQSYPGEAVWLDGSSVTTGWVEDGVFWRKDITLTLDRSPTYSRGALDSTTPGWQWVNPSVPTAPWPEQVFIDGVAQEQVDALAKVGPGKFYVAGTATGTNGFTFTSSAYYIGTDPTGKEVRISDRTVALTCLSANMMVRGVGFRRYSNSTCDFGVVKLYRNGDSMENCIIEDCATTGVWLDHNQGATLRKVTIQRCGLVGGGGNASDNTILDRCKFVGNSRARYNPTPVAGGWKQAHSQYISVLDCDISDNTWTGLWFDEAVHKMDIIGCNVQNNGRWGIVVEISEAARIANCLITGNYLGGVLIQNSNNCRVWNNTFADSGGKSIKILQDPRRPSDGAGNIDGRFSLDWYAANHTWQIASLEFYNNVSDDPGALSLTSEVGYGFAVISQESPLKAWSTFGLKMNGNLYSRTTAGKPLNMFLLAQAGANAAGWGTLPPYRNVVAPQESTSKENIGSSALDSRFMLTPAMETLVATAPQALPADIAALIGVAAGTKHVGVWRD